MVQKWSWQRQGPKLSVTKFSLSDKLVIVFPWPRPQLLWYVRPHSEGLQMLLGLLSVSKQKHKSVTVCSGNSCLNVLMSWDLCHCSVTAVVSIECSLQLLKLSGGLCDLRVFTLSIGAHGFCGRFLEESAKACPELKSEVD